MEVWVVHVTHWDLAWALAAINCLASHSVPPKNAPRRRGHARIHETNRWRRVCTGAAHTMGTGSSRAGGRSRRALDEEGQASGGGGAAQYPPAPFPSAGPNPHYPWPQGQQVCTTSQRAFPVTIRTASHSATCARPGRVNHPLPPCEARGSRPLTERWALSNERVSWAHPSASAEAAAVRVLVTAILGVVVVDLASSSCEWPAALPPTDPSSFLCANRATQGAGIWGNKVPNSTHPHDRHAHI